MIFHAGYFLRTMVIPSVTGIVTASPRVSMTAGYLQAIETANEFARIKF